MFCVSGSDACSLESLSSYECVYVCVYACVYMTWKKEVDPGGGVSSSSFLDVLGVILGVGHYCNHPFISFSLYDDLKMQPSCMS